MQLLYLSYNNYSNRIVKKEATVADYQEYLLGTAMADWNPNDGVNTTIVVNETWSDDVAPDYLVCVENNQIISRWFITEYTRLRGRQFKASFRRDVIADYYDKVISAPAFIEKATLENNDPYIFNIEKDVTFNQIKKTETLLKDETECAWVVGYVPRDAFNTDTEIIGNLSTTKAADYTVDGINNWEFYQFTNLAGEGQKTAIYADPSTVAFNIYTADGEAGSRKVKFSFNENGGVNTGWQSASGAGDFVDGASRPVYPSYYPDEPVLNGEFLIKNNTSSNAETNLNTIKGAFSGNDFATMKGYIGTDYNNLTSDQAVTIQQLDGKIIKDTTTNLYYSISVNITNSTGTIFDVGSSGDLYTFMKGKMDALITSGFFSSGSAVSATSFRFAGSGIRGTLSLQQFSEEQLKTTITKDRYHLIDAPYDMFCMPYSSDVILKFNDNTFTTTPETSLNIGVNIGLQSGSGNVYDLQLLPYCPIKNFNVSKSEDGKVTIDFTNYPSYNLIKSGDNYAGAIFWASTSNFETTINSPITVNNPKVENQTDLYRICSPNYSNAFDFNAAMNGGLDYYIVECTYKPWTPYIHVYPNFKLMYGTAGFKDARGLICGGEFSLPQMSNEWANYQMQNKVSLNVFDKTVSDLTGKNAELSYSEAMYALNPSGETTAAINYAIQYDYYKYGYNIGNIMAMPTGLSKTSALTYNNKLFPFVEYYTCTDEEKAAFNLKLKYDGMTVMRISDVGISAFIKPTRSYIKAKLIRIEDLGDDAHMWKAISDELYKGIFIGG